MIQRAGYTLAVLHVEDSSVDAELVHHAMKQAGYSVAWNVVDTEAGFLAGLRSVPDLILSDYSLPQFDGFRALRLLRKSTLDIPFILVSATIGEERAVEMMREGVTDFLMKDRLPKLGAVVERALNERAMREEHRKLERELRLQAAVMDAAANAITITDPDGVIVWVNKAFERLTGYCAQEAIGKTPRILKSGEQDESVYHRLWTEILAGKTVSEEFVNLRKDGARITVLQTITPVRARDGSIANFIGIMADITEQRELEARFVQAQKMEVVGRLASGIAHDFNNILTVVMGNAGMILDHTDASGSVRTFAEEISDASELAAGLTRQLLMFCRRHTVEAVRVDLNDVVVGMDKLLRRLLDDTVQLTVVHGDLRGQVLADAGYVGQVLMNLVVNARDAMPDGGKLRIETAHVSIGAGHPVGNAAQDGEYLVLSVSDTGMGMSEEVQARIFDAFFTTKPVGKGTGLGLSTSMAIVNQFGGHIDVSSEPGIGTTFRVYLPLAAPAETASRSLGTATHKAAGSETILVVEDDPMLRQVIVSVLQARGYDLLEAQSGQDGLRVASTHDGDPIRLVIADVVLPDMSGNVMTDQILRSRPDIRILLTSGYAHTSALAGAASDRGQAFLPKPFTPEKLIAKVHETLNAPGLVDPTDESRGT